MANFAKAPEPRDQIVLFPQKLDEAIPIDHRVRLFDDILRRIDWKPWEDQYDLCRGQPPLHPRIVAGLILYGILNRVLSSRQLEEAVIVRNDFRWLVEGHSIDHSTICYFRHSNSEALKKLFVQIGLIAQRLGHLPLQCLGFDGTRMRANNRIRGSRSPEQLQESKAALERQFAELEARASAADAVEDQVFDGQSRSRLAKELADIDRRRRQVAAALAELEQAETKPPLLPITDPQSRITPNKDGGFAPNYTPLATVDIDSGLIVSVDVIPHVDEHRHLIAAVKDVQSSFGLASVPPELLTDSMMCTGENLTACKRLGIEFYSPSKSQVKDNPAEREHLNQPVPETSWDRLPVKISKSADGTQIVQLSKEAFIYDEANDQYWCPAGKPLRFQRQTREVTKGRERIRFRYFSNEADCAQCPLAARCLNAKSKQRIRSLSHEEHEATRRAHVTKMNQASSKAKYARRNHAGEQPFAVIKSQFGVRRFASRGLKRVRNEWLWLTSAFNLTRLFRLLGGGADPPPRSLMPQSS